MSPFLPADPAEVAECVAEAAAKRTPLSITGLGSKAALGRPMKNAGRLDLSRLDGVTYYESGELVFSALAGTPIETIETMLAKNAQELAFEPMSFAALYGAGNRNDRWRNHGQSFRSAPDQGGRGAGFCLGRQGGVRPRRSF